MTIFVNPDDTRIAVCDGCGAQTPYPESGHGYSLHTRRPDNVWCDNSGPFFERGVDEDGRRYFQSGFTDFCPRCSG